MFINVIKKKVLKIDVLFYPIKKKVEKCLTSQVWKESDKKKIKQLNKIKILGVKLNQLKFKVNLQKVNINNKMRNYLKMNRKVGIKRFTKGKE